MTKDSSHLMQNPMCHLKKTVGAGLLVALLASLAACDQGEKQAKPKPPPPPVVTAYTAVEQDVPLVLPFSGTLQAVQEVNVIPRVSGYVKQVYFQDGRDVKQGDKLYLIDPRPYQETLANYQAERATQEASYKFWKGEVARYSKLVKQGAVSQQQVENAIANQNKFAAQIQEQDANIKNAQLDLDFTTVLAPFDGRMEQTMVHEGANVSEQQSQMTRIVQLDPIYVIFNASRIDASNYQQLKKDGTGFDVKDMVVEVLLPNGTTFPEKGQIDFISAEIDPTTDTTVVRGVLPNPIRNDGSFPLLPGQYAPVQLTMGSIPNAVVIPAKTVVETQEGNFVYVIGADNKIEFRKVELGHINKDTQVVTKGLKKGETIVLEGLQKVKSGVTVKVEQAAEASSKDKAPDKAADEKASDDKTIANKPANDKAADDKATESGASD